jgi:hypothetical protein
MGSFRGRYRFEANYGKLAAMINRLVVVAAVAMATACANYSQLQDAETMRAGKTSVGVGVSFTRYDLALTDPDDKDTVNVPALVGSVRRGITDTLEVQATAWLPLGARAGVKYQLLGAAGETGPHISLGGHLGYLSVTSGEGANEASSRFVDLYLPVYVGYRLATSLAVYVAPQYILRTVMGDGTQIGHVLGGSGGVALGSGTKVFLEAGYAYDTLYDSPIISTALGLGF